MLTEVEELPGGSKISVDRIGDELYVVIPFRHLLVEKVVNAIVPALYFCVVCVFIFTLVWDMFVSGSWYWADLVVFGPLAVFFVTFFSLVYRKFKPSVSQRLGLLCDRLLIDTGCSQLSSKPLLPIILDVNPKDSERISLPLRNIQTIRMESGSLENKLIINHGDKQIEIAPAATLLEKRWLYNLIRSYYQLG